MKDHTPWTVAVTGGSGFIGRHVTGALKAMNYAPVQLTPFETDEPAISWDLQWEAARSADLLKGFDVLVHLAAYIPPDYADPAEVSKCLALNALGTANILRAAQAAGVRQFIYTSTAALYAANNGICATDSALFPQRAVAYLASKLAAEIYVQYAARNDSLICNTLRLASVYGPGMSMQSLIPTCVQSLRSSGSFEVADGNRYQTDLVFVGDVARAVAGCVGKTASSIYNVGTGKLTSPKEVALCAAELLRLPPASVSVATAKEGPSPEGIGPLDIATTVNELDFTPLDLRQGLKLYLESLR